MNERAAELGMKDTRFVNCTGLDDSPEAAEHRTSAYDIALMSRQLLKNHPDIRQFTTIWTDTVRNGTFGLSNTNKLIRFYQGATGLKTGYTSGAGYCLSASAQRDGMELIAVVMGADTSASRNTACKQLLDHGFANYAVIRPELPEPEPILVKLGRSDTVEAVPGEIPGILLDKGQKGLVQMEVSVEESVEAPVSKGQRLGTMTVKAGDQILQQIPLVAAEGVERLRYWELVGKVVRRAAMGKS
jgi:D-alanyl-D-alanine carboxypeptidase (penicillin-binding protein 5/6)